MLFFVATKGTDAVAFFTCQNTACIETSAFGANCLLSSGYEDGIALTMERENALTLENRSNN